MTAKRHHSDRPLKPPDHERRARRHRQTNTRDQLTRDEAVGAPGRIREVR